jgi:hypothetical protein
LRPHTSVDRALPEELNLYIEKIKVLIFKFLQTIEEIVEVSGAMVLLVHEHSAPDVLEALRSRTAPYYGAIFPELVAEGAVVHSGALVAELGEDLRVELVPNMSSFEASTSELLKRSGTLLCFTDAFSAGIRDFLGQLFETLADGCHVVGGGSGKMTLRQEPVIFSNEGMYADAALLIGLDRTSGIGVGHGWEHYRGPFLVTAAEGNTISGIDFGPAAHLYQEVVEQSTGQFFTDENFFDLAKSHPFGIVGQGSEMVVRDPVACDGGSIHLVGPVSEYAVVNILRGDRDSLLKAAEEVAERSLAKRDGAVSDVLIFDCISRSMFLDKGFQEELDRVSRVFEVLPLFGALTLGEIASNGSMSIEFHNKTCVVAAL